MAGESVSERGVLDQPLDRGSELVGDEMLNTFAVIGEYDEIAGKFIERYAGLLNEVRFSGSTDSPPEQVQIRKIIQQLKEATRT